MTQMNTDALRFSATFSKDVPLSMANAIRRSLLLDVPTLAPDEITVEKNTSPFPCEMIAHRISLCPVRPKASERQRFRLKAVGPGCVYSDAVVKIGDDDEATNIGAEEELLAPGIFLFSLAEKQAVELHGQCRVGTGREHARFQPACAVALSTDPEGASTIRFEALDSSTSPPENVLIRAVSTLRHRLRCLKAGLEELQRNAGADDDRR